MKLLIIPLLTASTLTISAVQFEFSMAGPGLKNAKLGIDEMVEQGSAPIPIESPLLRNENPPDAKQGVDGSARKEEKDDLHVNAGDCVSQVTGDPLPKLMS